ncbi:MAG: beta-phosphoglucomutase [Bacillota bacterium]
MTKEIKAFILDLDGVITDTAEFHFKAWKKMADEEGIPFNREDNEKLRGVSRRKSMELILDGREMKEEKIQKLMDRKNRYYNNFLKKLSEDDLLPGAKELIDEIINRNFKIAVASSSRNAKTVINNLGIENLFETISDGHSVENSKPAPDLFLHTAKKLDVEAEKCVVIEDAKSGIEGALAANMIAVGVGPEDRVGKAHYRYDKVKDIDLNEIIN